MLKPPLKILADENMPALSACFSHFGTVKTLAGRDMKPKDVQEADVLLVRSITQVNESLLKGSRVKFVGSATIGTDHIDQEYLQEQKITFANAPGSNAQSVVEYVLAAIAHWCQVRQKKASELTIGIIGKGQIGGRLARFLGKLNVKVKCHDPPLQSSGTEGLWFSLEEVLACDVITCHVPYTLTGPNATHHLIGLNELKQIKPSSLLINTARGSVVDNQALLPFIIDERFDVILDVWEGEPNIDINLMNHVMLATPHIAGYALEAKIRGTYMLYETLCCELNQVPTTPFDALLPIKPLEIQFESSTQWVSDILKYHHIRTIDTDMRNALNGLSQTFDQLRKNYPTRHEFLLSE